MGTRDPDEPDQVKQRLLDLHVADGDMSHHWDTLVTGMTNTEPRGTPSAHEVLEDITAILEGREPPWCSQHTREHTDSAPVTTCRKRWWHLHRRKKRNLLQLGDAPPAQ